ncbi:type VI secretion system lipoprotein TssJ, partial [Salmonella enterica subsp. arizonae serovar 62:z4,z23:-]|nr:type VI secretion system lipoprotein TssJ [Salmonella enterica subsp. arizonae]EDY0807221.1 type VI secretion system lipoprotein TssJ [Salmonella enterica subsp. arizonae serovar 62:z4,z23:-]
MWKTISIFNPSAGCGLTQTVTDGTVSITKSIFYKK